MAASSIAQFEKTNTHMGINPEKVNSQDERNKYMITPETKQDNSDLPFASNLSTEAREGDEVTVSNKTEWKKSDRFGFIIEDNKRQTVIVPEKLVQARKLKEAERVRKWIKMLNTWSFVIEHRQEKLKRRVRKGVPDAVRSAVWPRLCGSATAQQMTQPVELRPQKPRQPILRIPRFIFPSVPLLRSQRRQQVQSSTQKLSSTGQAATVPAVLTTPAVVFGSGEFPQPALLELITLPEHIADEIERDVNRTFPKHVHFIHEPTYGLVDQDGTDGRTLESGGQQSLRRVLHWYATADPDIGYCQGMGFIVGMLLTYLHEEDAFRCFHAAMTFPRYNLRDLYQPTLQGSKRVIFVFGRLCRTHLPQIHQHIHVGQDIHPSMYMTGWVMTLFTRDFSFDLCTRVWEIFLNEGFKIVYRVALALLQSVERRLLACQFEGILTLLRDLPGLVDPPSIIEAACSMSIKGAEIDLLHQKMPTLSSEEIDTMKMW